MYKMALLLFSLTALASCKKTTDFQWVVVNNSSNEIVVQLDGEMESYSSETFIPAGERETIGLESVEGSTSAGNPTDMINAMAVFTSVGADSTTKDFNSDANWALGQESGTGSTSIFYIYTFELTDADF